MDILILDDEQLDLFIAKKLLSLEFKVSGFTTIPEALAWAAENTFDVVLIDYYLGTGVHAHDALKQLKQVAKHSFKAYVLSNHVDEKQIQDLRAAGFNDVMYKPISLEKFKQVAMQA